MQRLEADVRADQQACQFASMLGGKPNWPSLNDRRRRLDEALSAEPVRIDPEQAALREALGLRGQRG